MMFSNLLKSSRFFGSKIFYKYTLFNSLYQQTYYNQE